MKTKAAILMLVFGSVMLASPASALAPYYDIEPVPKSDRTKIVSFCDNGSYHTYYHQPADLKYGYIDEDDEKNELGSTAVLKVSSYYDGPCTGGGGGIDLPEIVEALESEFGLPVHVVE